MNKIGRKKTVLLSLAVTFASLLIPVFGDGYVIMLLSFSLLGIGNALMQTSLNPLLSNIITGDKLICQSNRFFSGSLYCHVGSHPDYSHFRTGLESVVSYVYGDCSACHRFIGLYSH